MHRDIKPSNFLYSFKTKQYKLVDFGLVRTPALLQAQPNQRDGTQAASASGCVVSSAPRARRLWAGGAPPPPCAHPAATVPAAPPGPSRDTCRRRCVTRVGAAA